MDTSSSTQENQTLTSVYMSRSASDVPKLVEDDIRIESATTCSIHHVDLLSLWGGKWMSFFFLQRSRVDLVLPFCGDQLTIDIQALTGLIMYAHTYFASVVLNFDDDRFKIFSKFCLFLHDLGVLLLVRVVNNRLYPFLNY